jgi:hypothetical protein
MMLIFRQQSRPGNCEFVCIGYSAAARSAIVGSANAAAFDAQAPHLEKTRLMR